MSTSKLGFSAILRAGTSHQQAIAKVTEALKSEGFGVLTTIDVQTTLKNKINVDIPSYTILGACSPGFAHQALKLDPEIGLMLPCNVIVYSNEDGSTKISVQDPHAMMAGLDVPGIEQLGEAVAEKLKRVADSLDESNNS
jgi:uncharacterized protein (DUF302 family)